LRKAFNCPKETNGSWCVFRWNACISIDFPFEQQFLRLVTLNLIVSSQVTNSDDVALLTKKESEAEVKREACPEKNVTFLSKITFWWFTRHGHSYLNYYKIT